MIKYREIIRLKATMPSMNNTTIAASVGSSRNTVSEVWRLAHKHGLVWPLPESLKDSDIASILYPDRDVKDARPLLDCEYIYNELAKPNVTLSLLWSEYCAKCKATGMHPYQYKQFIKKYKAYGASKKATLRIKRKHGDSMEVDWAGSTMPLTDTITGEEIKRYLFVACLPCNMYNQGVLP